MTERKARTALGQASEAVTLARDLQDRIRTQQATIAALERENRELRRDLATAELCLGRRGTIGEDDE